MSRAERVMLALAAFAEAAQPAELADGLEPVATIGQNLVDVGLMAHVPNDPVARAVIEIVQGDGELDDSEARGEVPPDLRDRFPHEGSDLAAERFQLVDGKPLQLGGVAHPREERRSWCVWHNGRT